MAAGIARIYDLWYNDSIRVRRGLYMVLYAVIMLSAACSFFLLGRSIYRGNTDLIHDYHQTKVKDKAAYGKAFGKAMFTMAFFMAVSGFSSLFTDSFFPVAVLFLGLAAGILQIIHVQRKFNNGIF